MQDRRDLVGSHGPPLGPTGAANFGPSRLAHTPTSVDLHGHPHTFFPTSYAPLQQQQIDFHHHMAAASDAHFGHLNSLASAQPSAQYAAAAAVAHHGQIHHSQRSHAHHVLQSRGRGTGDDATAAAAAELQQLQGAAAVAFHHGYGDVAVANTMAAAAAAGNRRSDMYSVNMRRPDVLMHGTAAAAAHHGISEQDLINLHNNNNNNTQLSMDDNQVSLTSTL